MLKEINGLGPAKQSTGERISQLQEYKLRIGGNLDPGKLRQEIVDLARILTGARYGALLTFDKSGQVGEFVISGMSLEQAAHIRATPSGKGILGALNDSNRPLRISDMSSHAASVGFPENHPQMKSFMGIAIRHGSSHLANLYLADREIYQEFTAEDEEIVASFVSQAGVALANAERYEQALQKKADLEALIDISPVAVIVFDARTGRLALRNREAERIFHDVGIDEDSWEDALRVLSYRRADGREISLSELPLSRVLRSGETIRAEEIMIRLPNGRSVTTLINAAPIYSEQGEIDSVVVYLQDMSPLEEMDRMRADFLSLVSHELKTPLATIKGSLSALEGMIGSSESGEASQLVKTIDLQTDLMRSQIDSLLDLTHIESGSLTISPATVDLALLLEEGEKEFLRGNSGHRLELDVKSDLPKVTADRQRILQVLQTLLGYGVKCSPPSSTLRVSARQESVHIEVNISIDGRLLPSPELADLFRDVSHRESNGLKRKIQGDRMALAICKGIMNAHGGRLWAERGSAGQLGHGITLSFSVPIADTPVTESAYIPAPASERANPVNGGKARILAVMANPRMLGAAQRTLSHAGYVPIGTLDFKDVRRLIPEEKPHLVLLDLSKPRQQDFEMIHDVCQVNGVPAIVLSGQGDDENIVRAFEMGADDYIVKPFSPSELIARIKASLRKRAGSYGNGSRNDYATGDLVINYLERRVTVGGKRVHLTATEYQLLYELSTRAGRVSTQDELLRNIWGEEYVGDIQLLRAFIKTLRQKLGDKARRPTYIFTEHGVGYRMPRR